MPATPRNKVLPHRAARCLCATVVGMMLLRLVWPTASTAEEVSGGDEINWTKERRFWSFTPPVPQVQPRVKDRQWPRQPLDFFILARLEKRGLAPSVEADKRTLIRSISLSLQVLITETLSSFEFATYNRVRSGLNNIIVG